MTCYPEPFFNPCTHLLSGRLSDKWLIYRETFKGVTQGKLFTVSFNVNATFSDFSSLAGHSRIYFDMTLVFFIAYKAQKIKNISYLDPGCTTIHRKFVLSCWKEITKKLYTNITSLQRHCTRNHEKKRKRSTYNSLVSVPEITCYSHYMQRTTDTLRILHSRTKVKTPSWLAVRRSQGWRKIKLYSMIRKAGSKTDGEVHIPLTQVSEIIDMNPQRRIQVTSILYQ